MTFAKLAELIKENDIPEDVTLMSDSGWECDPTDMDGVWYCASENTLIFTQEVRWVWQTYEYLGIPCDCLVERKEEE